MRSSFQNLDMFQSVSTYDTAYNISNLCPLYICKISWIFETGNITFKCMICMNVNFEQKDISNLKVYNVLQATDFWMILIETSVHTC